jgi:4-amino-4-deoxy-L-arabinose transferase-like glycosyltransferase
MRTSERVSFRTESTALASERKVAGKKTPVDGVAMIVFAICVLAVTARLILINQPYIDHWSWRQSDVAAIARNFFQNGFRFGYPQIDWAGNTPGYVGTEFPILPFLAAICYRFAAVHEWIGRVQAVILFAASLPFFFLLVRKIFGSTAAVWASFFYGFAPLNVFAGRSFMPDVPSLSLAIVGLYFFLRWVEHGQSASLCVAAIAISLSFLIKITSVVMIAPLLYVVVGRSCQFRGVSGFTAKRPTIICLIVFTAIALIPSAIWYGHAYQIAQEFYPHHFFGAGGIQIESFSWYAQIAQQTFAGSLTPALAAMALAGLFVPRGRDWKYTWLFHWWLAAMIVFIVIVGYGNRHRWYQLPLVPIASAFAGAACAFVGSRISSRPALVTASILFSVTFLIFGFVNIRPFYEASAQLRDAGLELKKVTPPDALIVAADMGDPTIFYYGGRKGWHFMEKNAIYNGNPDDGQQAIENLERLRRRGATHFVFTKNTFWWSQSYPDFVGDLNKEATLIEATPEFKIYRLGTGTR